MKRLLACAFGASVIASTLVFGGGGPAWAASCSGGSCNGHDPYKYGCGITSTTTATYTSGSKTATVYNRYSKGCNANWVEMTLNNAARSAGWQVQGSVWELNSAKTGAIAESCFPSNDNNSGKTFETCNGSYYAGATGWPAWTDMVDGTNYTEGPMSVFDSSGTFLKQIWANQ